MWIDRVHAFASSPSLLLLLLPIHTCARAHTHCSSPGNNYGLDGTVIKTQTNIERPPTSVNNVNMMEKMHNGTAKYTGATTGAASG